MAMERISSPPFLDETAQSMLLALQGIRSAVQPANVYLDLDITLATSGWSSAAPYTYNWTSDKINDSCSVKVSFLDGAEDTNPLYLEYEKTAGGIQFVAPVKPTAAIPVRIHIIYADANAVTDVDDEMVSSSAVSGAANVKEALRVVDNKIDTTNQALLDLGTHVLTSGTLESIQTQLIDLNTSMATGAVLPIRFAITPSAAPFSNATYIGHIMKYSGNRFMVLVSANGSSKDSRVISGTWANDTFYWYELAMKIDVHTPYSMGTVSANGSLTVTLEPSSSYIIVAIGNILGRMGMMLARTSSSSAVVMDIEIGTNVSHTEEGLNVTFSNSSSTSYPLIGLKLS